MPKLTQSEANEIFETYYPANHSVIHGRLNAARLAALMPVLVEFFRQNPQMVPAKFHEELKQLTDDDLADFQRVAMLRASGRYDAQRGSFTDKGPGSTYCQGGAQVCQQYFLGKHLGKHYRLGKAASLASAITNCENNQTKEKTLLSWLLTHATTLETLRDMRVKDVNITDLPCYRNCKTKEEKDKVKDLAKRHYELIVQDQGFACVTLKDEDQTTVLFQATSQGASVQQKNQIINAGKKDDNCFSSTEKKVNQHYAHIVNPKSRTKNKSNHPSLFSQSQSQSRSPRRIDSHRALIDNAANHLVKEIKNSPVIKSVIKQETDCIVRKGNMKGTFKVGFKSELEAQQFFQFLTSKGYNNVTLHAQEKYPMNADGSVALTQGEKGKAPYQHIVRFEKPREDVLRFLKEFHVRQAQALCAKIGGEHWLQWPKSCDQPRPGLRR